MRLTNETEEGKSNTLINVICLLCPLVTHFIWAQTSGLTNEIIGGISFVAVWAFTIFSIWKLSSKSNQKIRSAIWSTLIGLALVFIFVMLQAYFSFYWLREYNLTHG